MLLGIDMGTTNSKAGLFEKDGTVIAIASRPTETFQHEDGTYYYDPRRMWETMVSAIREVTEKAGTGRKLEAIGIASMAESGLLLDNKTGEPRSPFMPWFDTCSRKQAETISRESDPFERFKLSGLHGSFKLGLAKLLYIQDRQPEAFRDASWVSASGYIAYKLTGNMAFDYTLAARTYAFRIDRKEWDRDFISHFGLNPDVFPEAQPSGEVVGRTPAELTALGIPEGTPVGIAGHDHVAAALSVGSIRPGIVYDSMGTAETLVGTLEERELTKTDYEAGISFGLHIAKDRMFWMGGNAMSGGSVEWLRGQLADETLSYEKLLSLLESKAGDGPTGILYYPYLSGSGAPSPDVRAKAAFIGVTKDHGKAELIQAVLEGTAYQLESIRLAAEDIARQKIERLLVVGGGTRNPHWLRIKADITACTLEMPPIEEATMLGAAMAAGVGSGVYGSAEEAAASIRKEAARIVEPQPERHEAYRKLYAEGYAALQPALRQFYAGR